MTTPFIGGCRIVHKLRWGDDWWLLCPRMDGVRLWPLWWLYYFDDEGHTTSNMRPGNWWSGHTCARPL